MTKRYSWLVGACFALAGGSGAFAETAKVFFILPNTTTIRFERRDAPYYVAAMQQRMPEAEVIVQNGEGDPARQQALVEDAVARKADLIVFVSADANLSAGALKTAEDAQVPVLLYEHDAVGGKAEAHVLFDALAVGRAQGERAAAVIAALPKEKVRVARVKGQQGEYGTIQYEKGQDEFLTPLLDSGKAEIVCDTYISNWNPTEGQAFAEDCLTRNAGDVDVFITMNDGLGGGIVAALITQGYKPGEKIVTGGQNADLNAVQYVLQGWMDNTIFKDLRVMAEAAADLSVSILRDETPRDGLINGVVNNQHMDVPAAFLPVRNITSAEIPELVEAGIWTKAEACEGATAVAFCN